MESRGSRCVMPPQRHLATVQWLRLGRSEVGVPLALELAAARTDVFGVREIAAHLDERFSLLTSGRRTALPRHQTLSARSTGATNCCRRPRPRCYVAFPSSPGERLRARHCLLGWGRTTRALAKPIERRRKGFLQVGPRVRIRLAPAGSQERTPHRRCTICGVGFTDVIRVSPSTGP